MALKGGYKIIDLKGNDLTSASFTLDGIYEAIEGNYDKVILLSGIIIDSVEKADVFVTAEVSSSKFVIKVYDKTLTIDANDLVTCVNGGNHLYKYTMDMEFTDVDNEKNQRFWCNLYSSQKYNDFNELLNSGEFKRVVVSGLISTDTDYSSGFLDEVSVDDNDITFYIYLTNASDNSIKMSKEDISNIGFYDQQLF